MTVTVLMLRLTLILMIGTDTAFLTIWHHIVLIASMKVTWLQGLLTFPAVLLFVGHRVVRPGTWTLIVLIDLRVWLVRRLHWPRFHSIKYNKVRHEFSNLREIFPAVMISSEFVLWLTNVPFTWVAINLLEVVQWCVVLLVVRRRFVPNQMWWGKWSMVLISLVDGCANYACIHMVATTDVSVYIRVWSVNTLNTYLIHRLWLRLIRKLLVLTWSHCEANLNFLLITHP